MTDAHWTAPTSTWGDFFRGLGRQRSRRYDQAVDNPYACRGIFFGSRDVGRQLWCRKRTNFRVPGAFKWQGFGNRPGITAQRVRPRKDRYHPQRTFGGKRNY